MPGDFTLLAQLGAGHDGAAFRAAGPEGEAELRLLGPAFAEPLRREAALRRIRRARLVADPVVRRFLGLGLDAFPPWIALAPIDGAPLSQRPQPCSIEDAVRLLFALAGGLHAGHRVGAVHGRLSPATVWRTPDGPMIDLSGTTILPADGPPPIDDPASDTAALLRLGRWLLTGDEAGALGSVPAPVRAVLSQSVSTTDGRPTMGDLAERLGHLVHILEADISATAHSLPGAPPEAKPAKGAPAMLGRYRILERLGQGGMGEVFKAEDITDGSLVAIKTLLPMWSRQPEAVQRFRKEARLLKEANNPFVANLLEMNEDSGICYLAVEFVAGKSAGDLLENGPLPEGQAVAIAADVCRALLGAHAAGIIHRDIKPDNILLFPHPTDTGQVAKLSDFGLARHVEQSASMHLTRTGAVIGTPLYMSPEQCSGRLLSPAADIYSLGATLFHLLAGRTPFQGETPLALVHQHCSTPAPPLHGVSDGIARIVARALAKDPVHRYADAEELLGELRRLQRGEPSGMHAHPRLPACDPARVVTYEFKWELASSPEQLWPLVSNTERLNKAIALPVVAWDTKPDDAGKVRRHGKIRKLGIEAVWEEHPFEWVEGRRFGVLRQFVSGPFKWMISEVALEPRAGGGTALSHTIRLEPSGLVGRAFAALSVGMNTRRNLDRVYRRIDAVLKAGKPTDDAFEPEARISRAQRRRLDECLASLGRHAPANVVEALGHFLATAPAQEVARIRPLALARRLGLPAEQVVAACLHGAHDGLLVLMWDLLCPVCRIPSQALGSLRALQEHGHCEACDLDYELDFARSVEAVFRAHPTVRECETGLFCIGGPAHSPHVVAQVRIAAGERLALDLSLGEGAYRLRGPQLPAALEARVHPGGCMARWEVDLARMPLEALPMRLRPGAQRLALENPTAQELVVRVERKADRDDALTASRAVSLALFRELFGGEVLSAGQLASVASVALVLTDLPEVRELAAEGEAKAFARLRRHLHALEETARKHHGAMVKAVGEGALLAFQEAADAAHALLELEPTARAAACHGPALAATVNGHLDYFGAGPRLLGELVRQAAPGEWVLAQGLMDVPGVQTLLRAHGKEASMGDGWHRWR